MVFVKKKNQCRKQHKVVFCLKIISAGITKKVIKGSLQLLRERERELWAFKTPFNNISDIQQSLNWSTQRKQLTSSKSLKKFHHRVDMGTPYHRPESNSQFQWQLAPIALVDVSLHVPFQGRIQDFKLGGVYLRKLRRAEGGGKIFGVFRVKNHDFRPKNLIFSNFRVGARAGCALPLDPSPGHQFRNVLTLIAENWSKIQY